MFILPISHEESTVRRWPLVTIGIVAINILMLVYTMFRGPADVDKLELSLQAASHYARDRPWVRASAAPGCLTEPSGFDLKAGPPAARPEPGSMEEKEDQAQMKILCAAVDKARDGTFLHRYGFVADDLRPLALVTHQFLHGGVLHLVFNLWFLWLCGCNLEDRWGRPLFLLFYLAGGAGAALAHRAFASDGSIPMIGASGAVAAAMGAFLAILARTKIRFFYFFFIGFRFKSGTFRAAAYWMLPLWLATELFEAVVMKSRDGVAHWAHVGGFAIGAAVGAGMRFSGLDKKLDESHDEALTVVREDVALSEAAHLVNAGRYPEAITKLRGIAAHKPDDLDVHVELLRAATLARDLPLRQETYARLLVLYMNSGFADAAEDLYAEVRQNQMESGIPRATAFVIAEGFARNKKSASAILLYARVRSGGLVDELAVRAGVAEATILRTMGRRTESRKLLEECKASPFSTVQLDAVIETQLGLLGPSSLEM